MTVLKLLTAGLAALAFGLAAAAAGAAAPAALAIDVSGGIEPAVEPFSELNVGDKLELADDAQITFLHYATCEEVVIRGGRLLFTERQYLPQRGQIVEKKRTKCPQTVALKSDARIGGVRIRGMGSTKLDSRPQFVLTGEARDRYASVRFMSGQQALYEDALSGPRYSWPEGRNALAESAQDYALELVPKGNGDALRVPFAVKDGGSQPVTVIRVD